MIYQWKPGSRVTGVKAQAAGERLEYLQTKASVTPAAIVEDAKNKDSPLHGAFEWDVKKAAYSYWLETAKYLARSLVIEVEDVASPCRAFVSARATPDEEPSYMPIHVVMADPVMRRDVLAEVLTEYEEIRRKYSVFRELSSLFKDVEKVTVKHRKRTT